LTVPGRLGRRGQVAPVQSLHLPPACAGGLARRCHRTSVR